MQMPIPDDWNGTDWCCYVVEWPSSDSWRAILFGLLLSPEAGRFWDASTGSIIDAQAVGKQIEDRNCMYQEGDG